MELYFLRHGVAGSRSEWEGDDDERPLTEDGKARMATEAATIALIGLTPGPILTSPLVRARQTADILAEALAQPDNVKEDERLSPGFGPKELKDILDDYKKYSALILVGHEPDFSRVIGRLVGKGRVVMKKGGLAYVDLPNPKNLKGSLMWLIPPKILAG
jgi:phosphohistidine phosphatase